MRILYRAGYKYQTIASPVRVKLSEIQPDESISTPFAELTDKGVLTIRSHYAWDGPSGPTIDTENFMLGSLVHDCLYEMMRNEYLPHYMWKDADTELDRINALCGMSRARRWWVRWGLAMAGGRAAHPKNKKEIIEIEYAFD